MNYREFSGNTLEEAIEFASSYFNTKNSFIEYEIVKKNKNNNYVSFGSDKFTIKARPKNHIIEDVTTVKEDEIQVVFEKLSETSKKIYLIVEEVLKKMGYEYRINSYENKDDLKICIYGPNMKSFIQEDGIGIDSLKHIVNRIISKQGLNKKRLLVDINEFRKEKELYIKKLAQRLAEKAKKSKTEVIVNPMNSYDRRIFHLEIERIDGVKTESIGDGLIKKIRVIPK